MTVLKRQSTVIVMTTKTNLAKDSFRLIYLNQHLVDPFMVHDSTNEHAQRAVSFAKLEQRRRSVHTYSVQTSSQRRIWLLHRNSTTERVVRVVRILEFWASSYLSSHLGHPERLATLRHDR